MEPVALITPGQHVELTRLGAQAATFRAARSLPVHRWFPWIEGFSEEIPLLAIERHGPGIVYDPFLGSGTTAVTSILRGVDAAGAEINPFLRFVVRCKTDAALALRETDAPSFFALTSELLAEVGRRDHEGLNVSDVYIDREYFSPVALELISKIKTAIAVIDAPPPLRELFRLALASSLVTVSNMTRRTDLRRRRTGEDTIAAAELPALFERSCLAIATDIAALPPNMGALRFLAEDARDVMPAFSGQIDICVTSPPYLNGTNYARNTKLELWILDFIAEESDLVELHRAGISAGINSAGRDESRPPDRQLARVIGDLNRDTYDKRIPRMVAGYFRDMAATFESIRDCLRPGGFLYLDIGDSRFAGIHVPTDAILARLAEQRGFTLQDETLLRSRRSKDGSPLKQVLLRFKTTSRRRKARNREPAAQLRELVTSRPFQQPPYGARNWGHSWHSMCSYQAKLKPSIAHFLVREFSQPGDVVFDPFAGSGAVPLEANLQGRVGWGNDISPLAVHLLRAKAQRPSAKRVWTTFEELLEFVRVARDDVDLGSVGTFGFNGPLTSYYHPETLKDILAARTWLSTQQIGASTSFVAAATAHILHGNRPYALSRRSHPITPFAPTGPTEQRALAPRLRSKIERLLDAELPSEWCDGLATNLDACSPIDGVLADVVVTSPPFYGSTRFHVNNWIRLWFCGWDPADFDRLKHEFLEVQQSRDFSIYADVLRSLHSTLRPGGLAVWHLGLSTRKDMGAELGELAAPLFEVIALENESVEHCQSHGVKSQGVTVAHQFLVLRSL